MTIQNIAYAIAAIAIIIDVVFHIMARYFLSKRINKLVEQIEELESRQRNPKK